MKPERYTTCPECGCPVRTYANGTRARHKPGKDWCVGGGRWLGGPTIMETERTTPQSPGTSEPFSRRSRRRE